MLTGGPVQQKESVDRKRATEREEMGFLCFLSCRMGTVILPFLKQISLGYHIGRTYQLLIHRMASHYRTGKESGVCVCLCVCVCVWPSDGGEDIH